MICTFCNNENRDGRRYCIYCGKPLDANAASAKKKSNADRSKPFGLLWPVGRTHAGAPRKKPSLRFWLVGSFSCIIVILSIFVVLPKLLHKDIPVVEPEAIESTESTVAPAIADEAVQTPAPSEVAQTAVPSEAAQTPAPSESADAATVAADKTPEANTMLTPLMNLEIYNENGFVVVFQGFCVSENSYSNSGISMVFDAANSTEEVYSLWGDSSDSFLNGKYLTFCFAESVPIEPGQAKRVIVSTGGRSYWLPVKQLYFELDIHKGGCHFIYPAFFFDENGVASTEPNFSGGPIDMGATGGLSMTYLGAVHNGDSIMAFFTATNNSDGPYNANFTGVLMDGVELELKMYRNYRSVSPGETNFLTAYMSYPDYSPMPDDIKSLQFSYQLINRTDMSSEDLVFTVIDPIFD